MARILGRGAEILFLSLMFCEVGEFIFLPWYSMVEKGTSESGIFDEMGVFFSVFPWISVPGREIGNEEVMPAVAPIPAMFQIQLALVLNKVLVILPAMCTCHNTTYQLSWS